MGKLKGLFVDHVVGVVFKVCDVMDDSFDIPNLDEKVFSKIKKRFYCVLFCFLCIIVFQFFNFFCFI